MQRYSQRTGRAAAHAFQTHSVDLIRCARAYGLLLLVSRFQDAARLQQHEADQAKGDTQQAAMAQALKQLADLFALYWVSLSEIIIALTCILSIFPCFWWHFFLTKVVFCFLDDDAIDSDLHRWSVTWPSFWRTAT
jgi:hypothetical protein